MVNRGPPPVRSLQHIYGLPSNSPEEQQQADEGTLLASRSVEIIGAILKDQQKRRVPEAGTLENPPGSDTKEEGPAWELPEIKTFMDVFEGQVADYNTCAYQGDERVRWYKPGRWAGRLLDLKRLSKPCTCGQWVRHEPLVGAKRASQAAQYPRKLCEEYCKLVITAFKHTLQLEYWRNRLATKTEEVSDLKRKWLLSKERIYQGHPDGRKYEFESPLDPELWDAWLRAAADPEKRPVEWIRKGVPLGMSKDIPCCGIFPMADDPDLDMEEMPELADQLGAVNYKSFTEEPVHARAELGRLVEEGFAVVLPTGKAQEIHKHGIVSKLALIIKKKDDGSVKRRIIIDLLRSGGNARCRVPERIVLPRAVDVIESFRYLWSTRDRMRGKSRDEEWELDEDRPDGGIFDFELVTVDLSDAYCHLPVHPEEHPNCLSPGLRQSETLMWVAMLFGFKGAPLLMGRFAACLARIWQSLVAPSEMQSQLYMDDPMWILRGPTSRRNRNLALLLYTARALGINLAWHKGSRGSQLTWIGVMFEVVQAQAVIKLTAPKKMMAEVSQALEACKTRGMVSFKEVQQLTGRLSWIAGILPRTRWAVSIMYAVLSDAKRSENEERQRAAKRVDQRPKVGLIAVKRLELPRKWFVTLFKEPEVLALRTEPMVELLPD